MKTILAASDFSKASRNAIQYAAQAAKKTGAKLVLFHAYHPPVAVSDGYIVTPSLEEMKKNSLAKLRRIAASLHTTLGVKLKIEKVCLCGMAADELTIFAEEHKVDLVVMGMRHAGPVAEKLIGSIATTFIRKTKCPVLLIPENTEFRKIKKIVFASDYKNNEAVEPPVLKELSGIWKSQVHIVHVFTGEKTVPTTTEAIAGLQLDRAFQNIEHSFHSIINTDVVNGINEYVTDHKADLVVMSPRKHTFFDTLFKENTTKKMAFHALVPLLIIH